MRTSHVLTSVIRKDEEEIDSPESVNGVQSVRKLEVTTSTKNLIPTYHTIYMTITSWILFVQCTMLQLVQEIWIKFIKFLCRQSNTNMLPL